MGDAELRQQLFDALEAGAVQRGVDELQRINARAVADALVVDSLHKVVKAFIADHNDAAVGQGLVIVGEFDTVEAVDFFNRSQNLFRGFQRDLAAVRAVDLVAVVLGGVVAGGHADARAAAQIPHSPGQGGRRLQAGVHIGGDAVGRQHAGGLAGEQFAVVAAVVGDGDLFRQAAGVQVVGQTLRSLAHGVEVHAVGARADDAAQAAGAERKVTIETVGDGVVVARHADQFSLDGIVQIRLG